MPAVATLWFTITLFVSPWCSYISLKGKLAICKSWLFSAESICINQPRFSFSKTISCTRYIYTRWYIQTCRLELIVCWQKLPPLTQVDPYTHPHNRTNMHTHTYTRRTRQTHVHINPTVCFILCHENWIVKECQKRSKWHCTFIKTIQVIYLPVFVNISSHWDNSLSIELFILWVINFKSEIREPVHCISRGGGVVQGVLCHQRGLRKGGCNVSTRPTSVTTTFCLCVCAR